MPPIFVGDLLKEPSAARAKLKAVGTRQQFEKHSVLFKKGPIGVVIVHSGTIRLSCNASPMRFVCVGEILCLTEALAEIGGQSTFEPASDCSCRIICVEDFLDLLDTDCDLRNGLLGALARSYLRAYRTMSEYPL